MFQVCPFFFCCDLTSASTSALSVQLTLSSVHQIFSEFRRSQSAECIHPSNERRLLSLEPPRSPLRRVGAFSAALGHATTSRAQTWPSTSCARRLEQKHVRVAAHPAARRCPPRDGDGDRGEEAPLSQSPALQVHHLASANDRISASGTTTSCPGNSSADLLVPLRTAGGQFLPAARIAAFRPHLPFTPSTADDELCIEFPVAALPNGWPHSCVVLDFSLPVSETFSQTSERLFLSRLLPARCL